MKQKIAPALMRVVYVLASLIILLIVIHVVDYFSDYIGGLENHVKELEEQNSSLEKSNSEMWQTIQQYEFTIDDNRKNYNDNIYNLNESLQKLRQQNNELMECIEESGTHVITSDFTEEEIDLLSRCAQAEAGHGNYQAQIYVVNVILNRVNSDKFPNTIKEVIYQHGGELYQFTVVKNGAIENIASDDTVDNIKDALLFNKMTLPPNILFFHATGTESNCTPYIECEGSTFGY